MVRVQLKILQVKEGEITLQEPKKDKTRKEASASFFWFRLIPKKCCVFHTVSRDVTQTTVQIRSIRVSLAFLKAASTLRLPHAFPSSSR